MTTPLAEIFAKDNGRNIDMSKHSPQLEGTISSLASKYQRGEKLTMSHDAFDKLIEQSPIDMVLVEIVLVMSYWDMKIQYQLPWSYDSSCLSCSSIIRPPFLVGDLPFMSYHARYPSC